MLAIRRQRFICFLVREPYYYSENSISHRPLSYFCLFLYAKRRKWAATVGSVSEKTPCCPARFMAKMRLFVTQIST
jgi:hypothetical protein